MAAVAPATLGTSIPFAGSTQSAAMVFLLRHEIKPGLQRAFPGFFTGTKIDLMVELFHGANVGQYSHYVTLKVMPSDPLLMMPDMVLS